MKQRVVLRNVRTVHEEEPFDIVIENGFITELAAANTAAGEVGFDSTGCMCPADGSTCMFMRLPNVEG